MMTEQGFKDQFIITFVSTWCANNYTEYCMQGKHDRLENPPVEDAIFLANSAWKALSNHNQPPG